MVEQEGYTVWRGVLERQCPNVEVQHPKKSVPSPADEEEQRALKWCKVQSGFIVLNNGALL